MVLRWKVALGVEGSVVLELSGTQAQHCTYKYSHALPLFSLFFNRVLTLELFSWGKTSGLDFCTNFNCKTQIYLLSENGEQSCWRLS